MKLISTGNCERKGGIGDSIREWNEEIKVKAVVLGLRLIWV